MFFNRNAFYITDAFIVIAVLTLQKKLGSICDAFISIFVFVEVIIRGFFRFD